MAGPSADERAQALAAIRASHRDAAIMERGPSDCWVVDEGPERVVYLVDRSPGLPAGSDYTTWMVAFHGGEVVRVSRFSSTACNVGG